jgi:hypothetical protein
MIQLALQPVFHIINTFVPSAAAFTVFLAVLSSLPARSGKKGELQPKRATIAGMTPQRIPTGGHVKSYTIPTSLRPRQGTY